MSRQTRRTFLAAASAALGSALAGCVGGGASGDPGGDDSDGIVAQSSFFVFGDLTAAVAGETATAETLVPVGQHGHGWEPGPDLQATVLESDLFVYGMEGFQPWADDVVDNIRADGADVETVSIARDVELLTAGDHHEDGGSHQGGDSQQDDHAEYDPHFWLDPTRTATALATVRDAFLELDSENADSYRANAEDYREQLLTLHGDIQALAEGADDATVLVAGHGAFGYLEARYDIAFEALSGISRDAGPTPRDIERAQQLIAEHDIEYVVADPLESQRAAEQLVSETDASEVLPLTSLPGRTDEWASQGWGYVDVMREVNLPTLERVLAAQ